MLSEYAANLLDGYLQALEGQQRALQAYMKAQTAVREIKEEVVADILSDNSRIAQGKAEIMANKELEDDEEYRACVAAEAEAESEYMSIKITVEIHLQELKTYRAECYAKAGDLPF